MTTRRRKLIIGNWKMNGRVSSGVDLAKDLAEKTLAAKPTLFDLVICPPATLLYPVAEAIRNSPVMLGAQDCHPANHGPYTGEISAGMLQDLGCKYVILGHSERRGGEGETSADVASKVAAAHLAGLITIVCVGETQEQRAAGATESIIENMLRESLSPSCAGAQLVVAYEPVWAIGSGTIPSIEDIQRVHRVIRATLGERGAGTPILYGGSVAPSNAHSILAESEVDGVLVGSVSLNADGFWAVANSCR